MAVLRELSGLRVFPLLGRITLIGRDRSCDIVIGAPQASARHAILLRSGNTYTIEDLESANGTFVNGRRIHERTRLAPGDTIEMHGLAVTFHEDDAGGAGAARTPRRTAADTLAGIKSTLDVAIDTRTRIEPEAKLRAVLELSRSLSTALNLEEELPLILESLFAIFPQADRGFILLRDDASGDMDVRACRHRHGKEIDPQSVSWAIIEHTLATSRAVLSDDAGADQRFEATGSIVALPIRSVLCVPLLSRSGDCLGVIQLDNQDAPHRFREEDLDVLVTAGTLAARMVEFAQLSQEQRDLEAATQIQKSFLPGACPRVEQLRFFDHYAPAQHVGGDYYDYIALPGNRLAVAIGDVTGKGISAALLMARLSAAVRFCLASTSSLPEAVGLLNRALTRTGTEDRFVTFAVLELDLENFTMTLVNAGHPPPLRRRGGTADVDEIGKDIVGVPLAVADQKYEQLSLSLEPGDVIVLYTDGVTEARGAAGAMYGQDRLRAALQWAPRAIDALGAALLDDVRDFVGTRPQHDDLTIVCFGRRAP